MCNKGTKATKMRMGNPSIGHANVSNKPLNTLFNKFLFIVSNIKNVYLDDVILFLIFVL